MLVWSLVIWTASALGLGSIDAIRLITVAVLGGALVFGRGPRICALVCRSVRGRPAFERVVIALVAAMFLTLFAKSAVLIDYDSGWYGLQSEEVLVGGGSLFLSQGLVAVVHHYPKLYEALTLPFAGLGSTSMIFGVGILSWALVAFTVAAILREYRVAASLRMLGMALVATTSALANSAMTARGENFSSWLLLMGVLGLVKYRKGDGARWWWIAAATALGVQARLSNIPYAAILFGLLALSLATRWRADGGLRALRNDGLWVFGTALVLGLMITARSLMISGVVLVAPKVVVEIQQALGLHLKYPICIPPPTEGLHRLPILDGLWGILFDPARYPHLIITWTGNYWVFVPLAALLLGAWRGASREGAASTWPLLVLGLSFFVVMFGYKLLTPAGAGYYFIVPITCLALWGLVQADRLRGVERSFLELSLVPFVVCGMAIAFLTGTWGPGTRALDATMTRLPFEYAERAQAGLVSDHMDGIARFLTGMPAGTRVVGLEAHRVRGRLPAGWWLPVQYEDLQTYGWWQPRLVESPEAIQAYLQTAGIEFVIVPRRELKPGIESLVGQSLSTLHAGGMAKIAYQDDHYALWNIRAQNRRLEGCLEASRLSRHAVTTR
jgi:hypothetical protein